MMSQDILWIDDCDDNDPINAKDRRAWELSKIKHFFPKEYADEVRLVTQIMAALREIKNHKNNYNVIVFDINLRLGMSVLKDGEKDYFDATEYYDAVKKFMGKDRVRLPDDYNEFLQRAGIYLYLYLLNLGYPNDRIIMLTGNANAKLNDFLKSAHIVYENNKVYENSSLLLRKDEAHNWDWLKAKYDGSSDSSLYYRVRRLVYSACDYWGNWLAEQKPKDDNIALNKIYHCNKYDKQKVPRNQFCDLLSQMKMFFPVIAPENPEAVYYQALRQATSFHEESCNLKCLDDLRDEKPYHLAARSYRNWSAHNKLSELQGQIPADFFALMFCITLRTYFHSTFNDDFAKAGYERRYFQERLPGNFITEKFAENFKKFYRSDWNEIYDKMERECTSKNDDKLMEKLKRADTGKLFFEYGRSKQTSILTVKHLLMLLVRYYWKRPPEKLDKIEDISALARSEYLKYWAYKLYMKDKDSQELGS